MSRLTHIWRVLTRTRGAGTAASGDEEYRRRALAEKTFYKACANVHALPEIFHYWSNRYLKPLLESCGVADLDRFFVDRLGKLCESSPRSVRFVSVGAGNCDTEIRFARSLLNKGLSNFTLECIDLNEDMLARGNKEAVTSGTNEHITTIQADFNNWQPRCSYDAVIANQSLHHVLNLEGLFDVIAERLEPGGVFLASDMIGRNGHQRWPEALAIVKEFWRELPSAYRYNQQLRRLEQEFMDWDCAQGCFEGIRAQDILPLLLKKFSFEFFVGFGNVVDPFIDRSFGHNFDATGQWDRNFIDRVHARDELEICSGRITPTHMLAAMRVPGHFDNVKRIGNLDPEKCIRWPN